MFKKILPLSLLAISGAATADTYVGIGLGQATADIAPIDFGAGVYSSVNDSEAAIKFFGGFEVNRNFAVELGYTYLGDMGVDYTDGVDSLYETAESGAVYFAAVGSIPLGGASLFGKVGFASWAMDYSWADDWGVYASETVTGVDPMVGVGMQFDIGNTVSLRAEFERYMSVGDRHTIESDIDVLSASAVLWF